MNILTHGLVYKLPPNLRRMTFEFSVSMCVCLDKIQTPKTHQKTSLEHKVTVHIVSSILPNLSIQKLQLYQAFQYATIELLRTVSKS